MKLIIGLGNPGKKYKKTRHNVGFMVLDQLHEEFGMYDISDWTLSKKFNAEIAECRVGSEKCILAKPMTFMNKSGQAIQLIANYYDISPEDIIVIHDDIDLEFEDIRIQKDRGHAGHNGIKSIINHLNDKNFYRVRIGISTEEKEKKGVSDFVLSKFGLLERRKLKEIIQKSTEEVNKLI